MAQTLLPRWIFLAIQIDDVDVHAFRVNLYNFTITNARSSADSNAYVATVAEGSGSVGCEFHDEVGVKGGADPFQQRNRGHYAARFKP